MYIIPLPHSCARILIFVLFCFPRGIPQFLIKCLCFLRGVTIQLQSKPQTGTANQDGKFWID